MLSLLHIHNARVAEVQEVREIQTALGLVAAEAGVCVIPASARQMRSDVHYRLLKEEDTISPAILNHRVGDTSAQIGLVKRLIQEMYAENPPWLDMAHNLLPDGPADTWPATCEASDCGRELAARRRPSMQVDANIDVSHWTLPCAIVLNRVVQGTRVNSEN